MPKPYLPFVRAMLEEEFGQIGEAALESGNGNVEEVSHQIYLILRGRSKQEVRQYYKRLKLLVTSLARAEVYALFRAMFKPHEDEEFDSFCEWIILHGREFYQRSLHDPDSLAEEKWLRGRYYSGGALPIILRGLLNIDATGDWISYRLIPPGIPPANLPGQQIDVKDIPNHFPRLWERTRKPKSSAHSPQLRIRGPLTEDGFWSVIALANAGTSAPAENIVQVLTQLNKTQIRKFSDIFALKMVSAYSWDLWGVAFLLLGGCSDDAFSDFRAWLVYQGKETFEKVVADPESIVEADLPWESSSDESIEYSISQAYEEVSGEELPSPRVRHPKDPAGDEWEEDDLPMLFPRVAAFIENAD